MSWGFPDARRDAGHMSAGRSVNTLYQVVSREPRSALRGDLTYAPQATAEPPGDPSELLAVSVRYEAPDGQLSQRLDRPVIDCGLELSQVSADLRFAVAAATFATLLRGSPSVASATFGLMDELARDAAHTDLANPRGEPLRHAAIARRLTRRPKIRILRRNK